MNKKPLLIRGLATISPLGASRPEISESLRRGTPNLSQLGERAIFRLTDSGEASILNEASHSSKRSLDRAVLLALAAAKHTLGTLSAEWQVQCVSIGSARGATTSLESTILQHQLGVVPLSPETSPKTTAGGLTSWVAQELCRNRASGAGVASVGTSMTCTSALHSLLVAKAFIDAGMAELAVFGGTESCLTPYTLAQLAALRIYSQERTDWPCRPCCSSDQRVNSVVLGEGAGTALLCRDHRYRADDMALLGIGWSLEATPSATGISEDGAGFELAMQRAVSSLPAGIAVDAVILHAPGTVKGDAAELRAVDRLLGSVPVCTTKHLTGHTYGASGMVSLAMAQWLLEGGGWEGFPYPTTAGNCRFEHPRTVLVNTAGFGGNSISVIVSKPS